MSKLRFWLIPLCAAAALAAIVLLPPSEEPAAEQTAQAQSISPQEGCQLLQTLSYARCQHSVVRRVTAPVEVHGQTLEQVQALYAEWSITAFSAKEIKMERRLQLFCPDHLVLMPDGAGMLCVFENKYGDGMALVKELGIAVRDLPAAAREEAQAGIGFSTPEEMDMWLESVES